MRPERAGLPEEEAENQGIRKEQEAAKASTGRRTHTQVLAAFAVPAHTPGSSWYWGAGLSVTPGPAASGRRHRCCARVPSRRPTICFFQRSCRQSRKAHAAATETPTAAMAPCLPHDFTCDLQIARTVV